MTPARGRFDPNAPRFELERLMIGWDIEQYFPAFRARRFPHKGWTTKCQDSAPRSDDAPQKGGFQPLYADLFREGAQIELALGVSMPQMILQAYVLAGVDYCSATIQI